MFLSVKAVAFCRLVISFNRGCLQVPGLSVAGDALGVVGLIGVDMAAYFSIYRIQDSDDFVECDAR